VRCIEQRLKEDKIAFPIVDRIMNLVDDTPMAEDMLRNMHQYCADDESMIEPTPLSESIHLKHLLNQQHQLGLMFLEQKRSFIDALNPCQPNHSMDRAMRQKRNKHVALASHVLIHFSPYDLEELEGSWYTAADFAQFRKERKATIKALKNSNFDLGLIDRSKHNLRGLEAYFSASFYKKTRRKRAGVVKRVLAEQQHLREGIIDAESMGKLNFSESENPRQWIIDAESIRKVSCSESEWARDKGLKLGRDDAEAVAREMTIQPSLGLFSRQHSLHATKVSQPAIYNLITEIE
jgi:hypothetical protein